MITRSELMDWLKTCPTNEWHQIGEDDFWWQQQGCIRISFDIKEEENDNA